MIRHTAIAAALLCVSLTATAATPTWDDGDAIPEGMGVLVFKVEREKLKSTGAKRGAFNITLRQVGGDEDIRIANPVRMRGYLLPEGMYYLSAMRDIEPGGVDARGISNAGRAFRVQAGKVSWGGTWTVAAGAMSTQLAVSHDDDSLKEFIKRYGDALAAGLVMKSHEGNSNEGLAQ
jgi:hypothetical protein